MTGDGRTYIDFDLSIWSKGERYFARVNDSPVGASEEEVPLRRPFPNQSFTELVLRLENAVLRARGQRRGPASKEAKLLQDFGREMFNVVFREAEPIASRFTSSLLLVQKQRPEGAAEGLRLKLRIKSQELAVLPWEFVYDEAKRQHLCLQYRSPLVRFLDVSEPTLPLEVKGPVNILGMIANPGGTWAPLDTENERRRIDEAIAPLQKAGRVNFQWVHGDTSEHLLQMMRQASWHVFHFIGHGGVSEPDLTQDADQSVPEGDDGYVVFADGHGGADEVSASKLSVLLQGDGALRLVVLNCCDSARSETDNMFSSPGASLVRSGVPAVVAMQFPISDDAAIRFATGFYESIADNEALETALTSARLRMHTKSDVEWGIPVLFTRSGTGRLFSIGERPPAAPAPPPSTPTPTDVASTKQQAAREQLRRLFRFD